MWAILLGLLASQDDQVQRLRDPAQVFPVFQEQVRHGEYGKAYDLLSPGARQAIRYEEFYLGLASFEASRRLVGSLRVHRAGPGAGSILLCSPEFGISREIGVVEFATILALDFTRGDVEYFAGRALEWHRLQVKRADGWHFAYPPDWTYAPVARSCRCSP